MTEFRVIIPEERYTILKFEQDSLPGFAGVNANLKTFKPKEVLGWHCSIMLVLENLFENGMPSREEVAIIETFGGKLDEQIKGNIEKPNALFLARITWNETSQYIFNRNHCKQRL